MKMMMIVCDDNMLDFIQEILAAHEITGYTEIPGVHGRGHHGEKKESAVAPGALSLIFSAVGGEAIDSIIKDLEELRDSYKDTIPFGLRIFVTEIERMI